MNSVYYKTECLLSIGRVFCCEDLLKFTENLTRNNYRKLNAFCPECALINYLQFYFYR